METILDMEKGHCIDLLLRAPWTELSHKQLMAGRSCTIWLPIDLQIRCLPAYLQFISQPVGDPRTSFYFDILQFALDVLAPYEEGLVDLTSEEQRNTIAAVLELASRQVAELEVDDVRDELLLLSWWWQEKGSRN